MFGEISTHGIPDSTDQTPRAAKAPTDRSKINQMILENKIESLALTCHALVEILRQHGITSEMLAAKMEEIDLRDGKLDGRMSPVSKACGRCGRRNSKNRTNCLYCGDAA